MSFTDDVIAERRRQTEQEGWTPEHDDDHAAGALTAAAICYADGASFALLMGQTTPSGDYLDSRFPPLRIWPWSRNWWKPTTPRRDLVKAAALIIAEGDRMDRAAGTPAASRETQSTIAQWGDEAFGPAVGTKRPLLRAVNELVEALIEAGVHECDVIQRVKDEFARQRAKGKAPDPSVEPDRGNLASEVAGTVIVLYRVAHAAGFDLHDAIDAEMAKNRGRKRFAKGDGTGHHVSLAAEESP